MPAVSLARLNTQISELADHYRQPEDFVKILQSILDSYSDQTIKLSQEAQALQPGNVRNKIPFVVNQKIELGLIALVRQNPIPALAIADHLWQESSADVRYLAAALLGMVTDPYLDAVVTRFRTWAPLERERVFLEILFSKGSESLRRQAIELWLNCIRGWCNSTLVAEQRLGLLALIPVLQDRSFENLPAVYAMMSNTIISHPSEIQWEIDQVILSLTGRSQTETAYFLRQMLSSNPDHGMVRLVRRSLPLFSGEAREKLRSSIQSVSSEKPE